MRNQYLDSIIRVNRLKFWKGFFVASLLSFAFWGIAILVLMFVVR